MPAVDAECVALAFLWARVFPCGCEFSNLHFPDKMKSRRHKETWVHIFPCGCKFSHVGASFPTCTCLRQDEISSPQETWVQGFPSHVGASFQLALPRQDGNLVATRDKMEIVSPQENWLGLAAVGVATPVGLAYRQLPPPGSRLRRKCIRASSGSASRRRIRASSWRSLSGPRNARA